MESKEKIKFIVKSILIVRYISEYCKFEKKVLSIFREKIARIDHVYKNKLYFYYGIHVGHDVYYDFDKNCVSLSSNSEFNEQEMFKSLNLNKIIKFERREKVIKDLNFNVDSVVRRAVSFPFYDCCQKLISMRNVLAHETESIRFKDDKDIIENLSLDYLKRFDYEYVKDYDLEILDGECIALLSNIVYIEKMMGTLNAIVI